MVVSRLSSPSSPLSPRTEHEPSKLPRLSSLLPHTLSHLYHASLRQARSSTQVLHRLGGSQGTPVLAECAGTQLTILGDEQHAVEGDLWVVIDSYVFVSLPSYPRVFTSVHALIRSRSAGVRRAHLVSPHPSFVPFAYLSLPPPVSASSSTCTP